LLSGNSDAALPTDKGILNGHVDALQGREASRREKAQAASICEINFSSTHRKIGNGLVERQNSSSKTVF
jgi:hypothetical protein